MIRYTFGRGTIASALILPGFVIVDAFRNALPAVHRYRKDLSKKWRLDNPRPTMKLPHPDFLYDEFTKTQLGMNLETQEQTTAISQEAKIEPASLPNNEGEIDGLKRRLVQLQDDMDQAQRRATSSERRVNFLRKKLREMESVGATPPKENDSEVARQSTPYASEYVLYLRASLSLRCFLVDILFLTSCNVTYFCGFS